MKKRTEIGIGKETIIRNNFIIFREKQNHTLAQCKPFFSFLFSLWKIIKEARISQRMLVSRCWCFTKPNNCLQSNNHLRWGGRVESEFYPQRFSDMCAPLPAPGSTSSHLSLWTWMPSCLKSSPVSLAFVSSRFPLLFCLPVDLDASLVLNFWNPYAISSPVTSFHITLRVHPFLLATSKNPLILQISLPACLVGSLLYFLPISKHHSSL